MKKNITKTLILLLCAVLLSGCFHEHAWEEATCVTPRTCLDCGETEGTELGHTWEEATCDAPRRCKVCWEKDGDPLGHIWSAATCTEAATCMRCGLTEGEALGHDWTEAGTDTPAMCRSCGQMLPLELPATGQIFIGEEIHWGSTLTVKCSGDQACYVKLKDEDYEDVLSFFVRAGETAEVCVPGGYYYVYFAHGVDWYGPEHLFGSETTYSMDDELTNYYGYSWSYDLVPSYNGNFTDTPIDASQF